MPARAISSLPLILTTSDSPGVASEYLIVFWLLSFGNIEIADAVSIAVLCPAVFSTAIL